jgi:anti-sigma B factor antagonist
MELATTIEHVEATTYVVTLRGELDAFTVPDVRAEVARLIETGGALTLVVDLHDVTFLDSTALGTIVNAVKRMREQGGVLRIVRPSGHADRIFVLTGLEDVLDLRETRAAALAG